MGKVDHTIAFQRIISEIEESGEIKKYQSSLLDRYFGYENFYDTIKNLVENYLNILSKYRFDDVEDRLCEFFDEVPRFKSYVKFSISSKNSVVFINSEKINDKVYKIHLIASQIRDIHYHISKDTLSFSGISSDIKKNYIDEYMILYRPAFYISFGCDNYTESYNLLTLENLADRVLRRFKQLYNVVGVDFPYHREERRCNSMETDVHEYVFKIYVK